MSKHDETLRKTLEEVTRLRTEREESLREVAASEYSGRLRYAERVYWLYALVCVAFGVAAINFFVRSFDMKTLIGCAVIMLVIYETTVLMKLWFHTARMKMDVLKEMKLLRLEVARMGEAVGVEQPAQPPIKYEPMQGLRSYERSFWICVCMAVAIAISTWTSSAWFGTGDVTDTTSVSLAADGSGEKREENIHGYRGYYWPRGFSLYAPKDWDVRLLDPKGHEMPLETVITGNQARHDVKFTDSVYEEGRLRYTEVYGIPKAATLKDGIWTYTDGLRNKGRDKDYSLSVLLPAGAELVSTDPTAEVKSVDDRTHVHFQGTALDDVQYTFTVQYKLGAETEQEQQLKAEQH